MGRELPNNPKRFSSFFLSFPALKRLPVSEAQFFRAVFKDDSAPGGFPLELTLASRLFLVESI